jgi:hypothetical protein
MDKKVNYSIKYQENPKVIELIVLRNCENQFYNQQYNKNDTFSYDFKFIELQCPNDVKGYENWPEEKCIEWVKNDFMANTGLTLNQEKKII